MAEVEIYSLCLEAMSEEAGHDPDPVDVRAAAIEVAAGGVEQGLLVAGDLTRSGFVAWDLSPRSRSRGFVRRGSGQPSRM